jgi:hypothetical protein
MSLLRRAHSLDLEPSVKTIGKLCYMFESIAKYTLARAYVFSMSHHLDVPVVFFGCQNPNPLHAMAMFIHRNVLSALAYFPPNKIGRPSHSWLRLPV